MAYSKEYLRTYPSFEMMKATLFTGTKATRKVAPNTYFVLPHDSSIVLTYYGTRLVMFEEDMIILEPERRFPIMSQSDRRRINSVIPGHGVFQHDAVPRIWCDYVDKMTDRSRVSYRQFMNSHPIVRGGEKLDWSGNLIGPPHTMNITQTAEIIDFIKESDQEINKYVNWWEFMVLNGAPINEAFIGKRCFVEGNSRLLKLSGKVSNKIEVLNIELPSGHSSGYFQELLGTVAPAHCNDYSPEHLSLQQFLELLKQRAWLVNSPLHYSARDYFIRAFSYKLDSELTVSSLKGEEKFNVTNDMKKAIKENIQAMRQHVLQGKHSEDIKAYYESRLSEIPF